MAKNYLKENMDLLGRYNSSFEDEDDEVIVYYDKDDSNVGFLRTEKSIEEDEDLDFYPFGQFPLQMYNSEINELILNHQEEKLVQIDTEFDIPIFRAEENGETSYRIYLNPYADSVYFTGSNSGNVIKRLEEFLNGLYYEIIGIGLDIYTAIAYLATDDNSSLNDDTKEFLKRYMKYSDKF